MPPTWKVVAGACRQAATSQMAWVVGVARGIPSIPRSVVVVQWAEGALAKTPAGGGGKM